jgi:two-component system, OmpR family, response regulator
MAALSVFLVEDNPRIRAHLVPALANLGSASVMATAETEAQAIDWLAKHKGEWDLAVVDLFLKEGHGLGVLEWALGREPRQRVVVLTNSATEAMRTASKQAGADAIFDKSTELEEFFAYCLNVHRSPQPPA